MEGIDLGRREWEEELWVETMTKIYCIKKYVFKIKNKKEKQIGCFDFKKSQKHFKSFILGINIHINSNNKLL